MAQSRSRCSGMDVHHEPMAVADGAHDHGAVVPSLGIRGARQWDIEHGVRTMPSQAPPLLCV
jgi:hypothetical protein